MQSDLSNDMVGYETNFDEDDIGTLSRTDSMAFSDLHRSSMSSYQNLDFATYDYGLGQFSNVHQEPAPLQMSANHAPAEGQTQHTLAEAAQFPVEGGHALLGATHELLGPGFFQALGHGDAHMADPVAPPHGSFQGYDMPLNPDVGQTVLDQDDAFDGIPEMPPFSFEDYCNLSPMREEEVDCGETYTAHATPESG